ncbi:MAG: recombinase family protein, partial [Candidatus Absconditabacterales bacterium]
MARYRKDNPLMKFDLSTEKVVTMSVESEKKQIPLAIAYARISSDKQKNEGSGIQGQVQSCKDRCKNNGDIKIVKFFEDEAVSGTVLDREGLMNAIKFLEKENKQYTKITHFLCSEVSRIARPEEVSEGAALLSRIESTGVKIITTLEHRDTSTDEGKLMDDIKLSIARYERKKIMKRAKNGMVSIALQGGWPFGFVPPGYKKIGTGKNSVIEVDDFKANILSRGLEMYANNILISKIDLLNFFKGEGLTTNNQSFKGKLWISFIEKTFALHRLFFYAGYVMYPDRGINEPIQGKWKGIISLDVVYKIIGKLQKDG